MGAAHAYTYAGADLLSDLELPELEGHRAGQRRELVRIACGPSSDRVGHLLTSPSGVRCIYDDRNETVWCDTGSDTDPAELRHWLLDHVLPRVASHRGALMLHASSVSSRFGMIGFLGASGAGKSTLAAAFAVEDETWVSDDALIVDPSSRAMPSYYGLRLWSDSAHVLNEAHGLRHGEGCGGKLRFVPAARPPQTARDLVALFVLQHDAAHDDWVWPMKGHEATLAVVEHSFVLDTRDRAALVRRLERASRLAVSVPIFALRRARSYADLENARAAIVAAAWPGAR